jgi:hypothetical protein
VRIAFDTAKLEALASDDASAAETNNDEGEGEG